MSDGYVCQVTLGQCCCENLFCCENCALHVMGQGSQSAGPRGPTEAKVGQRQFCNRAQTIYFAL